MDVSQLLPRASALLGGGLAWFLVLALWQLRGAIRCMPLCLLHLHLLLTELNILVIGFARQQLVKIAAISTDIVRQRVHHSRSTRLGSSLKLSESFFGARDKCLGVCNFSFGIDRLDHTGITR